jgi:hypothetical protein
MFRAGSGRMAEEEMAARATVAAGPGGRAGVADGVAGSGIATRSGVGVGVGTLKPVGRGTGRKALGTGVSFDRRFIA